MTSLGFPAKFDKDIASCIAEFLIDPPYKLRDWIIKDKLNWCMLSINYYAVDLLLENQDKIGWDSSVLIKVQKQ